MIPKIKAIVLIAFVSLVFALVPSAQATDVDVGVRGGTYFDPDKGDIGAELLMNLDRERTWFFNPNFEYVFLRNANLWTFNFDVHRDLLPSDSPVYLWVGGGPAILLHDPDNPLLNNTTDFGVNVFTAIGFKIRGSSLVPYIQPKYTFSDNNRFSLAFGVRF
jgi:hypothetical protein